MHLWCSQVFVGYMWIHIRQTSPIISFENFWARLTLVDFTEKVPWILENFWAGFTFTAAMTLTSLVVNFWIMHLWCSQNSFKSPNVPLECWGNPGPDSNHWISPINIPLNLEDFWTRFTEITEGLRRSTSWIMHLLLLPSISGLDSVILPKLHWQSPFDLRARITLPNLSN